MLAWAALALGLGWKTGTRSGTGRDGRGRVKREPCDCKRMGWRKSNARCSEWEPFRAGELRKGDAQVAFCEILCDIPVSLL